MGWMGNMATKEQDPNQWEIDADADVMRMRNMATKEQDPNQLQREEFKRMKEKLESVEMIKIMQNFSFIKGAKEMDMIKIKLDKTIICICVIAIILFVVAVL